MTITIPVWALALLLNIVLMLTAWVVGKGEGPEGVFIPLAITLFSILGWVTWLLVSTVVLS